MPFSFGRKNDLNTVLNMIKYKVGDSVRLLKKGAEANLYLNSFGDRKSIVKRRVSKGYRLPEIDRKIREYRTSHEAQLLHEAKTIGVSTPVIFFIDVANFDIIMQYIEGERLRECLEVMNEKQRNLICRKLGCPIGLLHKKGIIHGDLTTSNLILTPSGKFFFIDFGLGFHSNTIEDQGVDLFLLKRALQSFHYKHAEKDFAQILKGYEMTVGKKRSIDIVKKIEDISRRGRYIPQR
ncbi:MAG: KEOPS complex kinase/ATPase Bud32 [Candidatus Bathyarchaeota archaeon]